MTLRFTPVFCFHSIVENPAPNDGFAYSAETFDMLLHTLRARGFHSISMRDLASGPAFRPKRIAFTFDDGYSNFVTTAMPLLRKHGFQATLYAVPFFLPEYAPYVPAGAGRSPHTLLSRNEFLEAAASPDVELGGHGITHRTLTDLAPEDALFEITECRRILERLAARRVDTFAFPRDGFDPHLLDMVKQSGFTSAVAGTKARTPPFPFPRIAPPARISHPVHHVKASGFAPLLVQLFKRSNPS